MKVLIVAFIALAIQQQVQLAYAVSCASNPCNLVAGVYDGSNGYCCTDLPPTLTDSVCTCPNNVPPVVNGPCRTGGGGGTGQFVCNRTCVNGGVCNIENGQEVCWCLTGFSGSYCELQGNPGSCATGTCVSGTCVQQTTGTSVYAYCHCNPGWAGTRCELCYFTCTNAGVFPDTANCALGRYFYCPQASGAPLAASCPQGQKFNRNTNSCDANYNCT